MLIGDEASRQLRELRVALTQDRQLRQPLAGIDRGTLRSLSGGEESKSSAFRGLQQLGNLGQRRVRQSVTTRRWQRSRDIQDALPAILEWRAHIQAAPGNCPVLKIICGGLIGSDIVCHGHGRRRVRNP